MEHGSIVYPEKIRKELELQNYDRGTNRFPAHVKRHTEKKLKVDAFAATCQLAGSESAPMCTRTVGLILVDEAAQATEPDVVQALSLSGKKVLLSRLETRSNFLHLLLIATMCRITTT